MQLTHSANQLSVCLTTCGQCLFICTCVSEADVCYCDWSGSVSTYWSRQQWSSDSCHKDKHISPMNYSSTNSCDIWVKKFIRRENRNKRFMRLGFRQHLPPCSTSASLLAPLSHHPVVPLLLYCSFSAILNPASFHFSVSEVITTRAVGDSQC